MYSLTSEEVPDKTLPLKFTSSKGKVWPLINSAENLSGTGSKIDGLISKYHCYPTQLFWSGIKNCCWILKQDFRPKPDSKYPSLQTHLSFIFSRFPCSSHSRHLSSSGELQLRHEKWH